MRMRGPVTSALAVLSAALLLGTGCARFNDAVSQPFTTQPEIKSGPSSSPPPPPPLPPIPFPKQCPAPNVMQGCLETTSGLIMLPDSKSALVAERVTGAVKEVSVNAEPKVKTVIPVDPAGDGGLIDIVLSPKYSQDRLMYAYVSTPTDNRVIRIADGDIPKNILTGIPKGATGNTGAMIFTSPTTLVVLTGDAGNPGAAADPASLAGKVVRIEQPTTVNQAPLTTAMTGMGAGGGMCIDPADNSLYITDRTPTADRLQRIAPDSKQSTVWTWPDRPGVAGCAAMEGTVLVNLVNTKQTVAVRLAPGSAAVTGQPEVVRQDIHGHAWALEVSPDGNVWAATVNKTFGDAEKLDDVVFPVFPSGGFPRAPDDLT
ncbi:PQQ-dependent sugar dehydrogenase [Mycobacterium sp.]|uniref:PQQ-dependent sugar dehydrogenase n=1 Tax=Mycobacterium sp. TaxID=1785 RepID=UPI002D6182FB|nr:PQQ-dependent sugar dehydrogenase [Mycobacterium sp.]HZA10967.1 PQQ-dependent sugar dehydrogenase [Mycobacterium sp.]